MSIVDRIQRIEAERDQLDGDIIGFCREVAKARGEGVPGTHNNGWSLSETGVHDYWNYSVILDPRPSIRVDWEYADCGSTPYWFPAHWMDLTEDEWKAELAEDVRLRNEAIAAKKNADEQAAALAREARDRQEYERLKNKFDTGVDTQ